MFVSNKDGHTQRKMWELFLHNISDSFACAHENTKTEFLRKKTSSSEYFICCSAYAIDLNFHFSLSAAILIKSFEFSTHKHSKAGKKLYPYWQKYFPLHLPLAVSAVFPIASL
jgi:hypothetical protein